MEIKKDDLFKELQTEIKQVVENAKIRVTKSINIGMLRTYWEVGMLICTKEKQTKSSGRELILKLSKSISKELGKGFSRSNLFQMRSFYRAYPDVQTLSGHLSWSHFGELLSVSNIGARSFYEKECINSGWSVRELKRQIGSSLFQRLLLSQGNDNKKKVMGLAKKGQNIQQPSDILRDPYVLEFLGIPENKPVLERDLEARLIRHLEDFLLELGRGFMFVGSQQRVTIGNVHHFVDMVFYNKILRAYVLIDLKMRALKPADVGQMNTYLNYFKSEKNDDIDNDPIGIILCADKDDIVAEYALGGLTNQIFASKYVYCLPDKELLIQQVQKAIHSENKNKNS